MKGRDQPENEIKNSAEFTVENPEIRLHQTEEE
jgi:hypothetical protein